MKTFGWLGFVWTEGTTSKRYLWSSAGTTTRYYHRPGKLTIRWAEWDWKRPHLIAYTGCRGNMTHNGVLGDEAPRWLKPCPSCFPVDSR